MGVLAGFGSCCRWEEPADPLPGGYVPEALIDCCTSCSATSILRLRPNSSVITELPSELGGSHLPQARDLSKLARRAGAVTEDAITSGLAPG